MIYLIHFARPLHHARHYLGFCEADLDARVDRHRAGHGSKLLRAVNAAGIAWDVVRTWNGGRNDERKLKNRKNARRLCPLCQAPGASGRKKGR